MAKTRRVYSGNATPATVPAGLAAAATSCTVSAATGWPGSGPFYVVVSPGTSSEEKVLVGAISGTTLSSLTRGVDGTSDTTHAPGAAIYPVFTAVDADEANELTSKWTTKGDIVSHGATTFATVSVGTNSHVLQADSTVAAGIKWGQVANGGIADSAVTTAKIADDAVTQAKIGASAVGTTELADDAVTQAKIGVGAVGTTELADAGVTEAKLATSVAGSGLAGGGGSALSVNVDNTGIEINADTLRLKDAGVVTAKLADDAVTEAKVADALLQLLCPTGLVAPYGGSTAPTGWLLCFGQAISRTDYAALFTAIGTTYGSGNGSTTFNVPDLRGRVIAGQDDMGGTSANRLTNPAGTTGGIDGDVLGGTGGSETHSLTVAQLAAHDHTGTYTLTAYPGAGVPIGFAAGTNAGGTNDGSVFIGSEGSGTGHNNVQPTIILNYIIRT